MIMDKETELSCNQAVTTDAASTNKIAAVANAGKGERIKFLFTVTEAFDTVEEDGTLTASIQHGASSDGPFTDLVTTGSLAEASLTAGLQFTLELPDNHEKYLQAYYNVGAHAFTAGKITCGQVLDVQSNRSW